MGASFPEIENSRFLQHPKHFQGFADARERLAGRNSVPAMQDAEPAHLAAADPQRRRIDDRVFSLQESNVWKSLARIKFFIDFFLLF